MITVIDPITKEFKLITERFQTKLIATLSVIDRLKEFSPIIGGSVGLYLQGLDLVPNDLDLIFQESDEISKSIIKSKFEDIYPMHIDIQCWRFNIRSIKLIWNNLVLDVQPAVDIIACKNEFEELYPDEITKIEKHRNQLNKIRDQLYF